MVMDESTVQIKGDLTIDTSSAQYKISNDDRNCVEAAVRAAKSVGGQAVGLTFGGDKAQKSLKDALSRGLNEVTWAHFDQAETADGKGTAKALAAAIGTMDDVALVLCSDGASDTLARQTAPPGSPPPWIGRWSPPCAPSGSPATRPWWKRSWRTGSRPSPSSCPP